MGEPQAVTPGVINTTATPKTVQSITNHLPRFDPIDRNDCRDALTVVNADFFRTSFHIVSYLPTTLGCIRRWAVSSRSKWLPGPPRSQLHNSKQWQPPSQLGTRASDSLPYGTCRPHQVPFADGPSHHQQTTKREWHSGNGIVGMVSEHGSG